MSQYKQHWSLVEALLDAIKTGDKEKIKTATENLTVANDRLKRLQD